MNNFLSVLVVGENPEKLMDKYDLNLKVKEYIKFKYSDAEILKNNHIACLKEMLNNKNFKLNDFQVDHLNEILKMTKEMSPFEYYTELTYGYKYDEHGNAITDLNPNGKWLTKQIGDNFSLPLILKNGNETHQALMCDINWDLTNKTNNPINYDLAWEIVINKAQPKSKTEKSIYENMKDKKDYLSQFKNKEQYISFNCAYWNYAFLDENGWVDLDDENNQINWVVNYYDRFIKKIKPTDLLTIYEYSVNKN